MQNKPQRGGSRPGAGRKPTGKNTGRLVISVNSEKLKRYRAIFGKSLAKTILKWLEEQAGVQLKQ